MPARKVGTAPFDLEAFFKRSDSIRVSKTAIDQQFESFLDTLAKLCKEQMGKTVQKRLGLGCLVGETCYQQWKVLGKQVKESWPWTDIEKKWQRNCGLTELQFDTVKNGTLKTSDQLITYLKGIDQLPQPKIKTLVPPAPLKPVVPSASTKKATTPAKNTVPAPKPNLRPIASYGTTPIGLGPKLLPVQLTAEKPTEKPAVDHTAQTQAQKSTSTIKRSNLNWDEKISDSKTQDDEADPDHPSITEGSLLTGSSTSPPPGNNNDSSDDESYIGPNSIIDYDYWAVEDPEWPGCYLEAPKFPGCGPWEITLPESLDPEVFIKPDLERINTLLGGIRLVIKLLTPSIKVMPTLAQRASMLAEKSEDRLVNQMVQATRWKAFRLLVQWAKHMRMHAKPPATPPMSMLEFVEQQVIEDSIKQGDEARDFVTTHIAKRLRKNIVLFPGRNYQVPKRPSVSEYEPPHAKRQRSSTYIPDTTEVNTEKDTPVKQFTEEKPQEREEAVNVPQSPDHSTEFSIRIADSAPAASPKGARQKQMDINYLVNARSMVEDAIQQSLYAKDYVPEDNGHVDGTREDESAAEQLHFKRENTLG